MCNIISLEDLEEDEDYAALLDDLTQGCAQFGSGEASRASHPSACGVCA